MPLRDAIAAVVAACPPDATVTVRWLNELLDAERDDADVSTEDATGEVIVDLTVAQVARRFGKGTSTVRTWLLRGELPGAYRSRGREWRIPPSSIEAMQRSQSQLHRPAIRRAERSSRKTTDIGAWRKHIQQKPA